MNKILRKNKKYIVLVLIAAIAFNFLFLPVTALAATTPTKAEDDTSYIGQAITWLSAKPILFAASLISSIFGAFFGLILSLEALIIDYIIDPKNFSLINTPVVTLGWGITRDIANMFFILILLVIAFATVLKIQSYAIKQLWWKVLVAALLINFSLVIAGIVIDFTQVLTSFFLNQITGGGFGTMTTKLASSMQILNFYRPAPPTSIIGGLGQFASASVAAVVGIILTLVGSVITVFIFGAAMIFLIVRILYIWFLLIIAPIIWMFWILPATSGYFKQWWDNFIKWTFFAPVYVFMIYLSLSLFDTTGQFKSGVFKAFPAIWQTTSPGLTTASLPLAIFQWIFVIAMMFGSLIVAKSFGVLPGKLIDAATGVTKGAAKASALWGIKTQGHIATAIGGAAAGTGATAGTGTARVTKAPIGFGRSAATGGAPTAGTGVPPTAGAGSPAAGTGVPARPPSALRRAIGTLGAYATGEKGGKFTAPLRKTPDNPLTAIAQGAVKGSGLWKDETKNWRCAYDPHRQVMSKKKPTFACPEAASHPAGTSSAAWVEI